MRWCLVAAESPWRARFVDCERTLGSWTLNGLLSNLSRNGLCEASAWGALLVAGRGRYRRTAVRLRANAPFLDLEWFALELLSRNDLCEASAWGTLLVAGRGRCRRTAVLGVRPSLLTVPFVGSAEDLGIAGSCRK